MHAPCTPKLHHLKDLFSLTCDFQVQGAQPDLSAITTPGRVIVCRPRLAPGWFGGWRVFTRRAESQGGAWCATAAAARLCARQTFGDAHAKLEEMNGA